MKKFNEFEAHLIERGLQMYIAEIVKDMVKARKSGRMPIFTEAYIKSIEKETLDKIQSLTQKQK